MRRATKEARNEEIARSSIVFHPVRIMKKALAT